VNIQFRCKKQIKRLKIINKKNKSKINQMLIKKNEIRHAYKKKKKRNPSVQHFKKKQNYFRKGFDRNPK
jgi:hypothetical protein